MAFDDEGRLTELCRPDGTVRAPIDVKHLTSPFIIALRTEAGEIIEVEPESTPSMECQDCDGAQQLVVAWQVHGDWGEMDVRATIELPRDSELSSWALEIENRTGLPIWEISYPRLSGLEAFGGDGQQDYLAAPKGMGKLCCNPMAVANRDHGDIDDETRDEYGTLGMEPQKNAIAFSYPGMWAMQYLALGHAKDGGVYFAAYDGEALYKRFGLYGHAGDGRHAALVMKQYPEDRTAPGADFTSFYPTMVGVYEGEWWAASEIYRKWALEQKWCQRGPTKDRDDIPKWTKQLDLWYWNWQFATDHGNHPKNLIPIIAYLKERFGCELAFHWYGCNGERGITSAWRGPDIYPENATIRRTLIKAVEDLHELGVRCIPYVNPRIWCEEDDDFLAIDGAKWLAVDEHGNSVPWDILGVTMCPTAQPAQEVMRRILNRMLDEIGMDGAYFDQISSCYAVPCFNPDHDHGTGGHDHWCRGYRDLLEKVQADAKERSPDNIITSESTIECYLDLLDLDLAREISNFRSKFDDPYCLPIPMFHSVYHDYHLTYGTVSTLKPRPDTPCHVEQFRYAEALCLVGGGQLMVSGVFAGDEEKEQYAPLFDYLETLTRAHIAARPFLNLGVWKPPLDLTCERTELEWQVGQPAKRDIPTVLNGCFELNGELCVVLVNRTASEQGIQFEVDPRQYGLTGESLELVAIHPGEQVVAPSITMGSPQQLVVPSLSAQVLVLRPA